jgi:S1-C subfamily serine protease
MDDTYGDNKDLTTDKSEDTEKFSESREKKLRALAEGGTIYQYRGYTQPQQAASQESTAKQPAPAITQSESRVFSDAPPYTAETQASPESHVESLSEQPKPEIRSNPAEEPAPEATQQESQAFSDTHPFTVEAQASPESQTGRLSEQPQSNYGYVGYTPIKDANKHKKTKKRRGYLPLVIIMIVAVVLSGIGGGLIGGAVSNNGSQKPVNNVTIAPIEEDLSVTEAVAQKVLNSVVGITTTVQGQNYFGQSFESTGEGSGIIVHSNGYILTNSHVVSDGAASKITVLLPTGDEVAGKLLWNDDTIDLAVLKVNETSLEPVEFGDSDKVRIGSYVAAIGNPLGIEFSGSITSGVVSGLNRSIVASSETKTTRMEGLIQVDAAINPGNSGGPLLNAEGQVIGVNTAKASAEGMGFAIPINTIKPIVDKVIKTGNFERAYMGITTSNAADIKEQYPDLELGVNTGAFINEVTISSPADKAGLLMKDVIIAVNDKKIKTSTELIKELLNYSAGETVKITYIRSGKEYTTDVELAPQSEVYGEPQQDSESGDSNDGSDPYDNFPFDW